MPDQQHLLPSCAACGGDTAHLWAQKHTRYGVRIEPTGTTICLNPLCKTHHEPAPAAALDASLEGEWTGAA